MLTVPALKYSWLIIIKGYLKNKNANMYILEADACGFLAIFLERLLKKLPKYLKMDFLVIY